MVAPENRINSMSYKKGTENEPKQTLQRRRRISWKESANARVMKNTEDYNMGVFFLSLYKLQLCPIV